MEERHENEQYFFNCRTIDAVADLLEPFERPCVLCAPMVGVELEDRGLDATTLDVDERFASLRGFRRWNIHRPEHLADRFGVIFCDPPFFNVSLDRLFRAVRVLAQYDVNRPVAITYLARRRDALLSTFEPFKLRPLAIDLGYATVRKCRKNDIELYANFEPPIVS